jgi:hypothetical protein
MLGPDQRPLQALGHERDERLAAPPSATSGTSAEVVVARGIRDGLDDLLDRTVEQLLAAPSGVVFSRSASGRKRAAPPPARERVRGRRRRAERVGGTGRGQRVELPPADAGVELRIAVARATSSSCAPRAPTGRRSRRRAEPAMWALRGPSGDRAALEERHAAAGAPTTQLSTRGRRSAAHDAERADDRPAALDDDTFELVPPHSTTIASARPSWCSAAATPAAGPEPIVKHGRRRKRRRSSRRRRRGARAAARRAPRPASACSTSDGGPLDDGRMLALTAALTVRISRP